MEGWFFESLGFTWTVDVKSVLLPSAPDLPAGIRDLADIPPSLFMKRIVTIAITLSLLGFIAICGGCHYSTIVRYLPDPTGTPPEDGSDGRFRPEIEPHFTKGGTAGLRCAIPLLWYWARDMDERPAIMFGTHYAPKRLNYDKMSGVVFEELVVTNEHGDRFDLTPEGDGNLFTLQGTGSSGRVEMGPVSGKQLKIEAAGYAITLEGGRSYFSTVQSWTDTRVTRWGLGIQFSE